MDRLTAVVVVHEAAAPDVRRLVALCTEHMRILEGASWAGVDELVGFSSVMECEACRLIPEALPLEQLLAPRPRAGRSHSRLRPAST